MSRLLFLTDQFPPSLGGVATSANRTVNALCGLGHQVDVLAWTRALQPGQIEAMGENPRIYRFGRFRNWDATFPHSMNLCDWLYSQHPYDFVWGHYLAPAGWMRRGWGDSTKRPQL